MKNYIRQTENIKCFYPGCPGWAKVQTPEWTKPFTARRLRGQTLGKAVRGVDFYHANEIIVYSRETADYLYKEYTPVEGSYIKGTLPSFEQLAGEFSEGLATDTEKALALLTKAIGFRMFHPAFPPLGPDCPPDRGLDDEDLLTSGCGWCNEQSRVFIRLCQVSGLQARMIHLNYSDMKTGHSVCEFYSGGAWHMADSTSLCVFPGPEGRLMSAAECHREENKIRVGDAYCARLKALMQLPDEELAGRKFAHIPEARERALKISAEAAAWRDKFSKVAPEDSSSQAGLRLYKFGVINYPLPVGVTRTGE